MLVDIRGQLLGIGSRQPCGSQRLNSGLLVNTITVESPGYLVPVGF